MNYAKLINKMIEKNSLPYRVNTFGIEYLNKVVHTLRYEDMLEICKILENTDEGFCYHSGHDTKNIYVFQCCDYEDCDLKEISNKAFKILYCDENDNSIETQDDWIPIFLIKEFWEFYEKFLNDLNEQKNENRNENEGEENMNEMEYDCENTSNTKEICRTIAADLLQNYESYENILNSLNEISEDDETDITILATLFERLFK